MNSPLKKITPMINLPMRGVGFCCSVNLITCMLDTKNDNFIVTTENVRVGSILFLILCLKIIRKAQHYTEGRGLGISSDS